MPLARPVSGEDMIWGDLTHHVGVTFKHSIPGSIPNPPIGYSDAMAAHTAIADALDAITVILANSEMSPMAVVDAVLHRVPAAAAYRAQLIAIVAASANDANPVLHVPWRGGKKTIWRRPVTDAIAIVEAEAKDDA